MECSSIWFKSGDWLYYLRTSPFHPVKLLCCFCTMLGIAALLKLNVFPVGFVHLAESELTLLYSSDLSANASVRSTDSYTQVITKTPTCSTDEEVSLGQEPKLTAFKWSSVRFVQRVSQDWLFFHEFSCSLNKITSRGHKSLQFQAVSQSLQSILMNHQGWVEQFGCQVCSKEKEKEEALSSLSAPPGGCVAGRVAGRCFSCLPANRHSSSRQVVLLISIWDYQGYELSTSLLLCE